MSHKIGILDTKNEPYFSFLQRFLRIIYIVVVAVKERKSNCNVNEKEVSILVAVSQRRKCN
jgi:hypothetical protein